MSILYQVHGVAEVKRFLGLAAQNARDPRPALKDAGEDMLGRHQLRLRRGVDVHGKPFKRSAGADRRSGQTLWATGKLASSVHYSVSKTAFDLFSSDPRARVHHEGLPVRPKNGKRFLTIPLDGATQGAVANRNGARARQFKNTFFLRFGAHLFLMQRVGKGKDKGSLRALFLLVRSVQMPRREWLGFDASDMEMVAGKLAARITGDKA